MFVITKLQNAPSDYRGRLGRRGHFIFVINVISSALILLISCGLVGVSAQQILLPQPANQQQQQAQQSPVQLGSLRPDQEAYVFSSSFDTERDKSEWMCALVVSGETTTSFNRGGQSLMMVIEENNRLVVHLKLLKFKCWVHSCRFSAILLLAARCRYQMDG